MSNWEVNNLEDLVFVDKEQLNNSTESEFSFFYIDIGSVSTNQIQFPVSPIYFQGSPSRARKVLHDGDILMATVRPNLKAFAKFKKPANRNCIASTGFAVLSKKENADINFIYYTLFSYEVEKQIEAFVVGSNYPALNTSDIRKLKILTPSIHEQRQIATILSTADAVIEKTQAAIAKYKAIKQGMLQDLFTRGIYSTTGKLRPSYQDAPELYKESKLGWIPKEWEVEEIGNVSSIVTNGFVGVATPYYTNSNDGVPYLFGTNIRADFIDYNNLRYISKDFYNSHIKSQLKPGDMLCVQSGHIGTCAVIPDRFTEANCHALIITRFFKEVIHPEFISFYLNSEIGKRELSKIIVGSTIMHINTSDLAKHIIPKPLIFEQKEITKKLIAIGKKLQTEQDFLHKQQQIKAGLMNDLLSGRKKVSIKEEEIA